MSDIMLPIPFKQLLNWMIDEYKQKKSIFDIPQEKFFYKKNYTTLELFGEKFETPIGPAAGPHTQVAQNIVAAYLTGSRFFELKTVQIMDSLDIAKPCIDAEDEGYNTEWSTELKVPQAFEEYVKAWVLLHVVNNMLRLSNISGTNFIFNMSVGYDLEGIKKPKIDNFIEGLKNAESSEIFQECKKVLKENIEKIPNFSEEDIEKIPSKISNSITLSTMHGCPPEEQESIATYLLTEKKVNTFVKLNPTLLGYDFVRKSFDKMGFTDIPLKEESFTHDLQYPDAQKMLVRLIALGKEKDLTFGVKLSNTLPVVNKREILPGDEMYMSGRTLFPLTINLAKKLAKDFESELKMSYSGGANFFNIDEIYKCGIKPITIATDLLKPGGYGKFLQIAHKLEPILDEFKQKDPDCTTIDDLAIKALRDQENYRESKFSNQMTLNEKVPLTDCFIAPCKAACPVTQDVPEYIRLIEEERFQKAYELIISKNPLASITGEICDHPCMYKCVRNDYECPLSIRELKKAAVARGQKITFNIPKEKVAKVAIIGAGPAGLSSAFFLSKNGFEVTVFDKQEGAGGMVKFGIPGFRISDKIIKNDLDLIKNAGVNFEFGVDPEFSVKDLKEKDFKYVNLAIGAWKSRMMEIEGAEKITHSAIRFLQKYKNDDIDYSIGKNVAVIGAGNSAMDTARALTRVEGVENTYIIYRRTKKQMPADKEELHYALKDGVQFNQLLNPIKYEEGNLICQVMKLGKKDISGRRRPVPVEGKTKSFAIDNVFSAIGELVDYDILRKNEIEIDKKWDIKTNDNFETSQKNVYIAGDALRGPNSIIQAVADGKKIAEDIMQKEKVIPLEVMPMEDVAFENDKRKKDIMKRKGVVDYGHAELHSEKDTIAEASRCLQCNYICNKCVEVCPNRANIRVLSNLDEFRDGNQILHLDALCNECGNCETFCPYDSAPYKDKFNYYWNLEDFDCNDNDGFLVLDKESRKFKIRLDKEVKDITFDKDWKVEKPFKNKEFNKLSTLIKIIVKEYNYILK